MNLLDYLNKNFLSVSPRFKSERVVVMLTVYLVGFVVFLYAKRVVFPDLAFDTINYHFFLGKSGVENFPKMFKASEFFPLGMHSFNPLLDSINYLAYELLGYRFGTALSALALLGSFALSIGIVFRVTGSSISAIAAIFMLPALVVNEGLFQIATYFTDNLYAFLVVSYVYVLLGIEKSKSTPDFVLCSLLLGFICGLLATKLTNVIYIVPLFIATVYLYFSIAKKPIAYCKRRFGLKFAFFIFLLPIFTLTGPYFFEAYQLTGNPIFPYYNGIFNSIYYPSNSWAFNFGPTSFIERLFYPYFALLNPVLLGEVKDLYPDVKLITTFGFIVAVFAAVFFRGIRLNKKEIVLASVTLSSFFIWQILFGYTRYAIALEILLGLSAVVLVNRLLSLRANYIVASLLIAYAVLSYWQSFSIIYFNCKYDIAWRPSKISFGEWKSRLFSIGILEKKTKYDRDLAEKLIRVDMVVQCVNPSSAYFNTFPDLMSKPMFNIDKLSNGAMTLNENYIKHRDTLALSALETGNSGELHFAIVLNDTNKGLRSLDVCMAALDQERKHGRLLDVNEKIVVDNFVGDSNQKLIILLGRYHHVSAH